MSSFANTENDDTFSYNTVDIGEMNEQNIMLNDLNESELKDSI